MLFIISLAFYNIKYMKEGSLYVQKGQSKEKRLFTLIIL